MPFPVLFPCHILASVFHVCPRVQYSVLRFRFYSLSFCHLEISHRKWPLPCQKIQHQSYTPLTWPTIHWTTKVHASKSLFPAIPLAPLQSVYLPAFVCFYTLCISMCICYFCLWVGFFFCCSFLSLLCWLIVLYVADLKMGSLRCVCALLFLMCVFLNVLYSKSNTTILSAY